MSGSQRRYTGRAAAPGVAIGPAFFVAGASAPEAPEQTGTAEHEQARLGEALEAAAGELEELAHGVIADVGAEEGEIFEAQAAFARDPELHERAERLSAEGASAAEAARQAFDAYRDQLAASGNEYLAARAADLEDVRDRVLRLIAGEPEDLAVPEEPSIVVAHELTPSRTAGLPRDRLLGIVTETGSPTSHAAILARALGVPAVVGVDGLLQEVSPGSTVAIDGEDGTVEIDPDEDTRSHVEQRMAQAQRRRDQLRELAQEPGRTADGHRVELAANVASLDDLELVADAGAEGTGLVRTELLFLDRSSAPSVEEQVDFYQRVLAAFPDQRVVFRTLDIGADKPLPFVHQASEPNPALGVRGIRLSLAQPSLLREQLQALLRASAGQQAHLAIMFPMVSRADELARARTTLQEVAQEEHIDRGTIEIGVMLEVPAALLAARRLSAEVDFFSIGTNDLLQYLFAADRLVDEVADLPDLLAPEVLRLLRDAISDAHAGGAWVGVCGEAAADPLCAAALVGIGVDELSMTPAAIGEIKELLRTVRLDDLRRAAEDACQADSEAASRATIEAALPELRGQTS